MVGRFFITCSGRLLDSCCYDQKQHAHYLHDVCIQIMCNNAFINLVLTGAVGTVYVGDYCWRYICCPYQRVVQRCALAVY